MFQGTSPKPEGNLLLRFRNGGGTAIPVEMERPTIRGVCALRAKNRSCSAPSPARTPFPLRRRRQRRKTLKPRGKTASTHRTSRLLLGTATASHRSYRVGSHQSPPPLHRVNPTLRGFRTLIKRPRTLDRLPPFTVSERQLLPRTDLPCGRAASPKRHVNPPTP